MHQTRRQGGDVERLLLRRRAAEDHLATVGVAEVLVDCVTYIVCCSVGLDVGGESIL